MGDCGCERERGCCDLREELAECCERAANRRVQRDYLKDQVEELHRRNYDLECDNLGLSEALDEERAENCRLREELEDCRRRLAKPRRENCGNGRFSAGCCN